MVSRFGIPAFGQIAENPAFEGGLRATWQRWTPPERLAVVSMIALIAHKTWQIFELDTPPKRTNPDEEDEARFKEPNIKDPPYLTPKEKKERLAWLETGAVIGDDPDWIITDDKTMEEFLRSWSGSDRDKYALLEAYGYDHPVEEAQSFTPAVLETRGGKGVGVHVPILSGKGRSPLRLSRETGQGVPEANPRRRKKR